MNAMMIVPFENGSPSFPGLPEDAQVGFMTLSYTPATYALVEITTTQANVDILTAQPSCLFLCNVIEVDGGKVFETTPLAPTDRVNITKKVKDMDFDNLGLINAAIQASQNRSDLVYALAYKAMTRNVEGDLMIEEDVKGQGLG